jgi:outer membrane immunogenic protein
MTRSVAGVSGLRIKSLLAVSTIAAAFAFAGAVSAADIAVEPEPEVVSDWTGFFLGVHAGVAGGRFEYPVDIDCFDGRCEDGFSILDSEFELDSSGIFAGGQIGVNWQVENFLLGVVGDISWTNLEGNLEADGTVLESIDFDFSAGSEVNWFGTIRGRLGWLWTPTFMTYVTGGGAFGNIEASAHLDINNNEIFDVSDDSTEWGWTVGGGAEYKITENLTFLAEYLFIDLGKRNLFNETFEGQEVDIEVNIDEDTQFHTLKAGFNWLF